MNERKCLSDILRNGDKESLSKAWDSTDAAKDFGSLPPADYVCRVASGELFTAKQRGTPGYKLKFEVIEGEYAGRYVWQDIWLTGAALPMAKRDLAKIGVTKIEQLEQPLPQGIVVRVKLALRTEDDGNEYNRVLRLEPVGVETPEPNPFAPGVGGEDTP
jgi:hypothetical protein